MAFGAEVTSLSKYDIHKCFENDEFDECDDLDENDEIEMIMLKMHESLKEANNKNKKLIAKNDALERANSKLVRELNTVKDLCRQM